MFFCHLRISCPAIFEYFSVLFLQIRTFSLYQLSTNQPKTQQFKTTNVQYLTRFQRVRIWEQLGCVVQLRESCEVAVKLLAKILVSEDLTGAGGYAPRWLTYMAVSECWEASVPCWLLAGYAQFLTTWASPYTA